MILMTERGWSPYRFMLPHSIAPSRRGIFTFFHFSLKSFLWHGQDAEIFSPPSEGEEVKWSAQSHAACQKPSWDWTQIPWLLGVGPTRWLQGGILNTRHLPLETGVWALLSKGQEFSLSLSSCRSVSPCGCMRILRCFPMWNLDK